MRRTSGRRTVRCASVRLPRPQSYLLADALLAAALGTGCDAVHPGYGFMAENAGFARRCAEHGLTFIGPSPEAIELMGDKIAGRAAAIANDVSGGGPGSDASIADIDTAKRQADHIGYPLLLKASTGGGGRGMRVVNGPSDLESRLAAAGAEAQAAFSDSAPLHGALLPEGPITSEVPGSSATGTATTCTSASATAAHSAATRSSWRNRRRRCSRRRCATRSAKPRSASRARSPTRTPAPSSSSTTPRRRAVLLHRDEHPQSRSSIRWTEMVTGTDLVREQLRVAAGEPLSFTTQSAAHRGHAVEWRINAEDPERGFLPTPGRLIRWSPPPEGPDVRLDTFVREGQAVTPYYDSMLAKLVVGGDSRAEALARSAAALDAFAVEGVSTTIGFQRSMIDHRDFMEGRVHTRWIEERLAATGP